MSSSQRDCPGWRISDAGVPRASKIAMFDEEFRKDDAMCRILQGCTQCAREVVIMRDFKLPPLLCAISSFHRELGEKGAPLGYCATTVILIPYHCLLRNSPDERCSESFPVLT